jgi:acyl-CoA dehydrogenase
MGAHEGLVADDLDAIVREVRRFVRDEVVPAEASIDENDEIPDRLRQMAADMGLFGFALPTEHGGLGFSMSDEVRLVFELGYTAPAFRSLFGTNNGIAGHVLVEGASEAQKASLLPRIASGDAIAAFCLTEAEAGSDPAGLSTTARLDGDEWVIDGTKRYITNAPLADLFMVFARTSKTDNPAAGISVFVVEAGTHGLSVGPKDPKMGQQGAWTADVYFDEVRTPASALIGTEGAGYATAMRCLAHGRLHIAALCVGLAERLVDESVEFAVNRRQGGKPIAEHQLIQALLADSQTELQAGRALVLRAAEEYDSGADRKMGPACAKYFASEMVGRVADRAVQVHGGAGYMRGVPVERFYRDVRLFRIYEGTSQIQQLVIARQLLKAAAK